KPNARTTSRNASGGSILVLPWLTSEGSGLPAPPSLPLAFGFGPRPASRSHDRYRVAGTGHPGIRDRAGTNLSDHGRGPSHGAHDRRTDAAGVAPARRC